MFTASSFFSVRFEQLFFDINKTYWGFGLKSRHLKTSLLPLWKFDYCFSLERSMLDLLLYTHFFLNITTSFLFFKDDIVFWGGGSSIYLRRICFTRNWDERATGWNRISSKITPVQWNNKTTRIADLSSSQDFCRCFCKVKGGCLSCDERKRKVTLNKWKKHIK